MASQWDAKNKTFIITGGASGLGGEYVQTFLKLGAKGIAILDIAEQAGKSLAERLNKEYNDKVIFVQCDMSKEEEITKSFATVLERFKQIDVIINNAGIMNDAIWRTACDVNWQGLVSLTFKGIKHMRKDEGGAGGTIINIASTTALTKFPFIPTYNGSKIAVLHFSQCLAMDPFYDTTNIRVLTMCFGPTDTPLLQNLGSRTYEANLSNVMEEATKDVEFQTVQSGVAAFLTMFEKGTPGSIWLSIDNKPAKDITSHIDRVFKELEELIAA